MCMRRYGARWEIGHETTLQLISKRRAANDRLSFDFEEERCKIDHLEAANFFYFKVVF